MVHARASAFFSFFSAITVLLMFGLASNAFGAPPPISANDDPPILRLAVLPNYDAGGLPHAEEIVATVTGELGSLGRGVLTDRLGNPNSARLMIERRLSQSAREMLDKNHPQELLHRYIVLEYPTPQAAMAAKARLQRDPSILFVRESQFASFAIAPADPLYPPAFGVTSWQWGIDDPLNLQAAWDNVRGTAFLAHLDNGVQVTHEDLGQALRRFRFSSLGGTDVDEHPDQLTLNFAGHGTHTAGIMAAATSQSSVPAGYPNPATLGGAGVCWFCNLMIGKISRIVGGNLQLDQSIDLPPAINWAVSSGAQVINLSLEGPNVDCAANPNDALCLALDFASRRHVVIAAAAGNSDFYAGNSPDPGNGIGTNVAFPARHPSTIAVGAIQSYDGTRANLWTEENGQFKFRGSSGGADMATRGILGPGREVLSSFYDSHDWNAGTRCGSNATLTNRGPRYGICTGTSMAAPHITGLVGLMRSVNPLLDSSTIRSKLLSAGDNAAFPSNTRGYGLPNAFTAVNNVLSTTNRLTPLFALYNSGALDHFYTVVPQQAKSAISGTQMPDAGSTLYYTMVGNSIAEYTAFPDPPTNPLARPTPPRAEAWLFSTFQNPFNASAELMPFYRLSWKCGDNGRASICASNPNHVSHLYSANLSETQGFIGQGYSFDAIEGYVLPLSQPQPAGTTQLRRAYNPSRDDYVVYPIEFETSYGWDGYQSPVTLGYVFYNNGSRPAY